MVPKNPCQSDDSAKKARWAARRQLMAVMFLATFSMFSPAPDLRPKPNLPVKYQAAKPSDPPEFDFDVWMPEDIPKYPKEASPAVKTLDALVHSGFPPYHPFRSEEAKARYLALYDRRARDWPVPCDTIQVEGAFGSTFVRLSGPVNGPPIVLLHGISSNSLAWMPNIATLGAHHRVYAVDHIADGGRSLYTRPLTSLADHLTWLDGLLDGLGLLKDVNLVGLSYGGWLAAQYAVARATRLRKVVLIAPAGPVLPLSMQWVVRAVACAIPLRYFSRSFMHWLLHDLALRPNTGRPSFDEVVAEAHTAMRCLAPHKMVPPTVMSNAELQQLTVPALYLVGENEKICPPLQAIERLKTVAPHIATQLIAHAGHDLTLVQADTVNLAILAFLVDT